MVPPFDGVPAHPVEVFRQWLAVAEQLEANDPTAAALATATTSGVPSVRMVLTKGIDDRGVRFFTNTESHKGHDLRSNQVAAMCFHWKSLRRQVRFQGEVHPLSYEETASYFHSRSRASQVAAAVSAQSQPLKSREDLDSAVRELSMALGDGDVPVPATWGGFVLTPDVVEFWMDGRDRLHDRLQFTRHGDLWESHLLYP